MEKTKHKVSRGMHYTTMIALIISNLTVLALAVLLAGPFMGYAMGDMAYYGELGKIQKGEAQVMSEFSRPPTMMSGWPVQESGLYFNGHVTVANLKRTKGYDTFVQSNQGVVVINARGEMTKFTAPDGTQIFETPVVGDLDNDGSMNVLGMGYGNRVLIWDNLGELMYDWQAGPSSASSHDPTLADLDNDDDLEILLIVGSGKAYAYHHDGTIVSGWPVQTAGATYSDIAVGDLDNDGSLEVLYEKPDHIAIWRSNGTPYRVPTIPLDSNSGLQHAPLLGDLDNDGDLEIIAITDTTPVSERKIYVFDNEGNILDGWPRQPGWYTPSMPVLADLDNDRDLEIVTGWDKMHAFHHDGSYVDGFPWDIMDYSNPANPTSKTLTNGANVLIGNADGDKELEIIAGQGKVHAYNLDGSVNPGWPIENSTYKTLALQDIDLDGMNELIGLRNNKVYAYDLPGARVIRPLQWIQYEHDQFNTNNYNFNKPVFSTQVINNN